MDLPELEREEQEMLRSAETLLEEAMRLASPEEQRDAQLNLRIVQTLVRVARLESAVTGMRDAFARNEASLKRSLEIEMALKSLLENRLADVEVRLVALEQRSATIRGVDA